MGASNKENLKKMFESDNLVKHEACYGVFLSSYIFYDRHKPALKARCYCPVLFITLRQTLWHILPRRNNRGSKKSRETFPG